MKRTRNLIKKIQDNSYIRILIELVLGTLLFNVSSIIGLLFVITLVVEIITTKTENMLCIYLFLSFFDEVLQNEYLGGSISRIIMVVIAIKLVVIILKNKIKPNNQEIGIVVFFIFSFVVGIITYKSINIEVLIALFNIFIFILFSMSIKLKTKEEVEHFIEKLLFTIVVAVLNSILYGLINNLFMKEIDGENIVYRFNGTYEPNFMSMYINLGIVSIMSLKNKTDNRKVIYLLCSILVIANILTVSMTGLAVLIAIIFLHIIINRKNFKKEIKDIVIIVIITITLFSIIKVTQYLIKTYEQVKIEESQTNIITEHNMVPEQNITPEQEIISDQDVIPKQNIEESSEEPENKGMLTKEYEESIEKSDNLIKRIEFLEETLSKGDFARLTSGRIPLIITFVDASFDRPLGNILFGNDATTKKLFSNYFYAEKYSHNSYIDILYNFGIIGFIIVSTYIFKITHKNMYLKTHLDSTRYKETIKLIRIMLLIYAFALSLYTKRMFLIFFLL